jgi:tetratricopeptide (TPR) repeat protein
MRCSLALVLSLFLASSVWAADSTTDEAKVHVRRATAAYNLGRYAEAAKEYEVAYEQTLDANLLFNVAQSHRLAGERESAITAYRSFIRSAPKSEQRGLAEDKVRELESLRSAPSPAGSKSETTASATGVQSPPATTASVSAAPEPRPTVDSASAVALSIQPSSTLISKEPVQASPFYARWPFWTAVGVAVAGGVVLGLVLTRRGNDLNLGSPSLGTKDY